MCANNAAAGPFQEVEVQRAEERLEPAPQLRQSSLTKSTQQFHHKKVALNWLTECRYYSGKLPFHEMEIPDVSCISYHFISLYLAY